ncbi:aminotransferase class V-fold PLP-dependent enzyme [Hoyosella rhizosphaerae]|uniref:Hercynylcysteine sulfoxide lyase n=1 Tax=Hoyosella rhizosphaerae TaxID=1755582 RepID=A0A916UDL1_9ACTN|nr:aminotransferase class V-fold PLP-dependent enzyme [Hoyosella rhizosphaerae]MBN4925636.1 aminotransferase class V-fold PLP-dependent enzyme [Hoyosella rhizosphaerae]GGC69107.1 putative hercynylcysteine sulfoxide lyase [Hoyosella rhizosphaerae]
MAVALPHPDVAEQFRAARSSLMGASIHLDSAAAGRMSDAVRLGISAHLDCEAQLGGYVAHEAANKIIDRGRADLGALCGLPPASIAFTESAVASLTSLLVQLQLPRNSVVAVLPNEYGLNVRLFNMFGFDVQTLPVVDSLGRADVDAVRAALIALNPRLVHLCQIASSRGIVQPTAEIVSVCRELRIPVVVDAAQGFGHVECDVGADAIYGTSRKWLCGPRGVGFIGVRPESVEAGVLSVQPELLESQEAYIAGRVGLSIAVREHHKLGPEKVRERLHAVGALVRDRLDGVAGWRVVEPAEERSSLTTLLPPQGWIDARVLEVRNALIQPATSEESTAVVTTFAGPERAPLSPAPATLRVSAHVDVTDDDLDVLADLLAIHSR